jgi:hypothetical protein
MQRIKQIVLVLGVLMLAVVSIAQAADFRWIVNCRFVDDGQQVNYWIGYSSLEALPDSYLAYIGNGPGIYMDTPLVGTYEHQMDVLLPKDDSTVQLFLYPEDVSITITGATEAPDCDNTIAAAPPTLDDQGNINNPLVNPRANSCYGPGQVCTTEADWEAGYYLIRKQYGMI